MRSWEKALNKICDMSREAGDIGEWMLVGSVGSVLQGCEMEPNDIDVYTKNKDSVIKFASLFKPFALEEKSDQPYHDGAWRSSREEPYFTQTFDWGFTWSKGVWIIEDFKVEVVHIEDSAGIPDSKDGSGIWEGGPYIWELGKTLSVNGFQVKVVPLEIQLESNMRRQRQDRVEAIVAALKRNGYDEKLLKMALSTANLELVREKYNL